MSNEIKSAEDLRKVYPEFVKQIVDEDIKAKEKANKDRSDQMYAEDRRQFALTCESAYEMKPKTKEEIDDFHSELELIKELEGDDGFNEEELTLIDTIKETLLWVLGSHASSVYDFEKIIKKQLKEKLVEISQLMQKTNVKTFDEINNQINKLSLDEN